MLRQRIEVLRFAQSVLSLLVEHYQGICRASGILLGGRVGEVRSLVDSGIA